MFSCTIASSLLLLTYHSSAYTTYAIKTLVDALCISYPDNMHSNIDLEAMPAPETSLPTATPQALRRPRSSRRLPAVMIMLLLGIYDIVMLVMHAHAPEPRNQIEKNFLNQVMGFALINTINMGLFFICVVIRRFEDPERTEAEQRANRKADLCCNTYSLGVFCMCVIGQVSFGISGFRQVA